MKRTIAFLLMAVMLVSLLTACGCKHEWAEATCTDPKTCTLCEETEGDSLGHSYLDATCEAPKTCSACALTEGEALGHNWLEATTEAPETCANCAATQGERIITDERFKTASCSQVFGAWAGQLSLPAANMFGEGIEGDIVFDVKMTFAKDGSAVQEMAFADWESVKTILLDTIVESMYMQYALMGLDKEAADAAVKAEMGLTMEELALMSLATMDPNDFMEPVDMVYYITDGTMYLGQTWEGEMEKNVMTLEGDSLTLDSGDGYPAILTRVTE